MMNNRGGNFILYRLKADIIIAALIMTVSIIFLTLGRDQFEQHIIRSSMLIETVEECDNGIVISYVDGNGNVTYAADKHYAFVVLTINDNSVLEQYYDENGHPELQPLGHTALLKIYNDWGAIESIEYQDNDGSPIMTSLGFSKVIRYYNAAGQLEKEQYFDISGGKVKHKYTGYGYSIIITDEGNAIITYLDYYDRPAVNDSGYTVLYRLYYKDGPSVGRIREEFYYDENNNPVSLSLGQFGASMEYDQYGRVAVITYLDEEGTPIVTNRGYTTVKQTYYNDDTIDNEMYFDFNGNPVALSHGQYGVKHLNGKIVYLNIEGKEIFDLSNYLNNNSICVIAIVVMLVAISAALDKKANAVLLVLYIAIIVYMTLMFRAEGSARVNLEIFWSYKQFLSNPVLRLEILNNVFLFIPLGAILFRLWPKKYVLLIPIIISLILESIQYYSTLGLCELDDVISNGIGGVIGYGFGCAIESLTKWGLKRFRLNGIKTV